MKDDLTDVLIDAMKASTYAAWHYGTSAQVNAIAVVIEAKRALAESLGMDQYSPTFCELLDIELNNRNLEEMHR